MWNSAGSKVHEQPSKMPPRQLYLPLAISLLCWQPAESALFSGWHGKQLPLLPPHPSPELCSARKREKKKSKRERNIFPVLLTTIYTRCSAASGRAEGRRRAAQSKYNNQSNTGYFGIEGTLEIFLASCPFLWYQDTLTFHLTIFPRLAHILNSCIKSFLRK